MTRLLFAAVIGLASALPAAAQFKNAEAAIKYRQSVMQVQSYHLGRIFAMANGRAPFDAKVAESDAALLDVIDKLPFVAFGEGTDKGAVNRAKPEIWAEKSKFDAAAQKMQDAVAKLHAAAKTGDQSQIKAAVGAAAQSCNDCHDTYRSK